MWSTELQNLALASFIRSSDVLRKVDDADNDVYEYIVADLGIERSDSCSARQQVKEAIQKLSGLRPNAEYYVSNAVVQRIKRQYFI